VDIKERWKEESGEEMPKNIDKEIADNGGFKAIMEKRLEELYGDYEKELDSVCGDSVIINTPAKYLESTEILLVDEVVGEPADNVVEWMRARDAINDAFSKLISEAQNIEAYSTEDRLRNLNRDMLTLIYQENGVAD